MRMKTLAILSAVSAFAAAPAFAANTPGTPTTAAAASSASATSPSANNAGAQGHPGDVGQNLRQDLMKAGFTDIRVMPEAYIVHAKNSSGDPVVMRVGPDAVTEVTEVPTNSPHGANPSSTQQSSAAHTSK